MAAKRKPRTKASSDGIAPTVRVSDEPKKAKPEGYVFGRPTVWQDRFCDDVIEWGLSAGRLRR